MNRLSRLFLAFSKPINLLSILGVLAIWATWTHWAHPWLLIAGTLAEIAYLFVNNISKDKIELYLSHSRRDTEFVFELSNLLQKACGIPAEKVLLRAFDEENHVLHLDETGVPKGLISSVAYVGVHTLSSVHAPELVFESGARWGAGKHFANLFACGAKSELSEGPMARLEHIDCLEMGQIFRLIHEVSQALKRKPVELNKYVEDAAALMELSRRGVKLQLQTMKSEPVPTIQEAVISAEFFRKG